ncbi:MAG: hypothetical protein NTY20_04115 [Candidatus Aenigmarchaeota archaeon]|nr:hypothetical protein [Candidatus Aenigmarchaeota archaeon]
MKSSVGTPQRKKAKSTIGQSELLASVMFMALVSTIVVAQNISYYNITHSITSSLIENSEKTIEATKEIEVWAASNLTINVDKTIFHPNESILIQATLLLDNSTSLSNQTVDFYIDSSLFSSITGAESELFQIEIPAYYLGPGSHEIKAVFQGAEYINPSESSVWIEILDERKQLEVTYSELVQGDVIIGKPVSWIQEFSVTNPNSWSLESQVLSLKLPEDASDVKIFDSSGNITEGRNIMIEKIEALQNLTFSVTFSTSPVEMEVINETINLSEILPEEAFNITVEEGNRIVLEADNLSEVQNTNVIWNVRTVKIRHNSTLHYRNIPVEIGSVSEDMGFFETEGKTRNDIKNEPSYGFSIQDGKARWIVPQLSEKEYEIEPAGSFLEQGSAEVGKPVNWTLRVANKVVEYETPAPEIQESESGENGTWKKNISVFSSLNDTHYTNVLASTKLPERLEGKAIPQINVSGKEIFGITENPEFDVEVNGGVSLFWVNGTQDVTQDLSHNVTFFDLDGDGLEDFLSWNVPELSEQDYVIEENPAGINVTLFNPDGAASQNEVNLTETSPGKYKIEILGDGRKIRPGLYRLVLESSSVQQEIWFRWGLISINTRKSIYHPGENAEILVVVLDRFGHLVSGANVSLVVTTPGGTAKTFSTDESSIKEKERGVYVAYYQVEEEGNYSMSAQAESDGVKSSITSHFLSLNYYEFDILRDSPVTVDPWKGESKFSFKLVSYTSAETFDFAEFLPEDFEVTDSGGAEISVQAGTKILFWRDLHNNSVISYSAQVPKVTPYLYQLGPAQVFYGQNVFTEARPWMLAADPDTETNTVEFYIGQRNTSLSSGTTNYFNFSFALPEEGVSIKSAFIEINGVAGSLTLASASISLDGVSPKSYKLTTSGESTRFIYRLDVTDILESYTGNGTLENHTLRTRFVGGATYLVNAKLIVSYEFSSSSVSRLKTVRYFVGQNTTDVATAGMWTQNFSVYIPESPTVKSAFIELGGSVVTTGTATASTNVSINGQSPLITAQLISYTTSVGYIIFYNATAMYSLVQGQSGQFNLTSVSSQIMSLYGAEAVITYQYNHSASQTQLKTIRYFAGQDYTMISPASTWKYYNFKLLFPEENVTVKSIYVKESGLATGDTNIGININGANQNTYTWNFNDRTIGIHQILYNATGLYSLTTGSNASQLRIQAATASYSIESAEIIVTYTYNETTTQTRQKTLEYFVYQDITEQVARNKITAPARFYIAETPVAIASVFIEETPTITAIVANAIIVDVDGTNTKRAAVLITSTAGENRYEALRYDSSSQIKTASKGWNSHTAHLMASQRAVHSAKIVTTYLINPPQMEVSLDYPPDNFHVNPGDTFQVNATVTCRNRNCGNINGTVRIDETPVSTTSGSRPFYATLNNISCSTNPIDADETCKLTFNVTANSPPSISSLDVSFDAQYLSVPSITPAATLIGPPNQLKTVEFFVNQTSSSLAADTWLNWTSKLFVPEPNILIRSAFFEVYGVFGVGSDMMDANTSFCIDGSCTGTYALDQTGELLPFLYRYDVTSQLKNYGGNSTESHNLSMMFTTGPISALNAKLILTYEYNPVSSIQMKTVRYFIGQQAGNVASGTTQNFTFSVYIPETPTVKSAFMEVRGVPVVSSATDIYVNVSINSANVLSNVFYDTSTGGSAGYLILYNASGLYSLGKGQSANYNLSLVTSGLATSLYGAELVLTYQYNASNTTESTELKTIRYYLGQDITQLPVDSLVPYPITVDIPESNVTMRSIYIKESGTAPASSGDVYIIMDIDGDNSRSFFYDGVGTGALDWTHFILYNATGLYSWTNGSQTADLSIQNNVTAGYSLESVELVMTYSYSKASERKLKTVESYIYQYSDNTLPVAGDTALQEFSYFIPEALPEVQSAFVEETPTTGITSADTLTVNVDETNEIAASIINSGEAQIQWLRYNAYDQLLGTAQGSNTHTASFTGLGASGHSAKLVLTYLTPEFYYEIVPLSNETGREISQIEINDTLNVGIRITNPIYYNMTGNVSITITNEAGTQVYPGSKTSQTFLANSTFYINFTGISTTSWSTGTYTIASTVVSGAYTESKSKTFGVIQVTPRVKFPLGVCLSSNRTMYVKMINYWSSNITINVTPRANSTSWVFTPAYNTTTITPGSTVYVYFNATSPASSGYYKLNMTVNYTDPNGKNKNLFSEQTMLTPGPSITVTREAPTLVYTSTAFLPRFVIHNDGCDYAQTISFNETVPSGWTVDSTFTGGQGGTLITLPDTSTRVVWSVPRLAINEFNVTRYKVYGASSEGTSDFGAWAVSYKDRNGFLYNYTEDSTFSIRSDDASYAHIEFDLATNDTVNSRRIAPNVTYAFNLTARNIGNANASANAMNITVYVPSSCNSPVSTGGGTWNSTTRKILWVLSQNITVGGQMNFTFTLNCTQDETELNFQADAISTQYGSQVYSNDISYSASRKETKQYEFTFTKPVSSAEITNFTMDVGWNGLDTGESGTIKIYNDNDTGSLEVWSGTSSQSGWSGTETVTKIAPDDYASGDFTTEPDNKLTVELTVGASAADESISATSLAYVWSWGGETSEPENLFVKSRKNVVPTLTNENLTADGDWGQPFNFSVDAYDANGNNVNVSLWLNLSTGWTFISNQTCSICNTTQRKYFIYNFTCADHDQTYQYKFTAEDPKYFLNETAVHSFTVEKDDVIFTVQSGNGSNAIANRTSAMSNLTLRLNLKDQNGSYVGGLNVTFFITMKGLGAGGVWDSPSSYPDHYKQTDSQGNVSYNFTAALNCNNVSTPLVDEEYEVGPHNWYLEVNSTSQCYKSLKSYQAPQLNDYYTFTTIDQLNNTIESPVDGSTIQQGRENVSILTYIYNYCQEPMEISTSNVTFNLSTTGASYLCTPVEKVGANVYQCEWETLNRTNGSYNFAMTSWATYYYNDTKLQSNTFHLQTVPMLKQADMTPHHDSWSKSHNFSVKVTDNWNDKVNVTLKVKVGSTETSYPVKCCGQGCTENPGNCSQTPLNWTNVTFACSGYADQTAFFWFEATDTQNYNYTTSVGEKGDYYNESEPNFFSIEKADVNITYISGNFSTATLTQSATFVVRAYDMDRANFSFNTGESPMVKFNVTQNFLFSTYALVNQTYANTSGYASVQFSPTPSFTTGNQSWDAYIDSSDSCFKEYNTTNYTVRIDTNYAPLYANETAMNVLYGAGVQRGWGEGWTFNITVNDTEGGNVNVSLQINSGSGWQVIQNQTCTACSNWKTVNFTVNLTCGMVSQTAQFRFVLIDNASNPNTNTTSGHTINIEKDDVNFEVIWGHNNITNRSSDYINLTLIARLRDENGTILGANINVSVNITKVGSGGGASWDSGRFRQTNSSGMINYSFFPTCDNPSTPTENEEYETGNHDWFAKVSGSEQCYKDSQSATYNFTVIDTLYNTIDLPNGDENYTTENSILMQGFVKNFCEEPITTSESNVWFNLTNGAYTTNCSTITRIGANVYKCSWNPSQQAVYGYYNVTMRSSYENSYTNITIKYPPETFYLFTRPVLKAANVTPRSDSWSKPHNFTINISDNLGDTVNVTLQTQILGGSWSDVSKQNCTNCSNNTLGYTVFNWTGITYPCSGYADQWMKFRIEAKDTEGNIKYTDILNTGEYFNNDDSYKIEKSDVNITYISGNYSTATLTVPATFVVRAYNMDNQTWNFSTGESPLVKFNVTTNFIESTYKFVNQSYANGTGYSTVTFTPDNSFANGNESWDAYIDSIDSCFKEHNTTNYTVTIDVNYPPLYRNETVNGVTQGASAGWGELWNFSVDVMDMEGDNLNISLQIDTGSGYFVLENKTCNNCASWTQLNFTESLDCGNVSSAVYYKFVILDNRSNPNTTAPHSFTIEKDDINYTVFQGASSTANRSGNQIDTLIVRVIDKDKNVSVSSGINGTFWITTNGIPNWDSGYNTTTDSNGNWTYNFNATCAGEGTQYEVGQQYWRFKTVSNTCYKNVDSFYDLSQAYTLTVKGQLNVTVIDPSNTNFTEGASVTFLGKLEDDCSDLKSSFPVRFIPKNGNYNESLVADSLGGGFYRYVWSTSGGKPGGWYNITMNGTEAIANTYYPDQKDYTFPNETSPLHAFYLEIYPRLKQANVTPRQDGWSLLRNFTINVSDEAVDNVTVGLWERISGQSWTQIDSSKSCFNCSNYTMNWNSTYDCSYAGQTMNFKFNASDNHANSYTTSVVNGDYSNNDDSFIIDKEDVAVFYVSGNETSVNRSAGAAALVLFINDTDAGHGAYSPESTVKFNITVNGSWSDSLLYGSNTTNATGHVNYYFNPNCSFQVGKQQWNGFTEDGCYKTNTSGVYNVTVYGDISVGLNADNDTYYQNDNIIVWINTTDDCGSFINVSTINITLRYNESVNYTCGNVILYNTGNYSCSWASSQQDPTGYYSVIVFATLPPNYNNVTYTKTNDFILYSYVNNNPMLTDETVYPEGWGSLTNFTVNVTDVDNNNVTVQLWESSSAGGPWTYVGQQTCWSCLTTQTINLSKFHTCSDANQTRYYKFNATDGQGGSASTTPHSFVVQKDNVTVYLRQGDGTQVNRSGEQYNSPEIIIQIYDTDNQTYVGQDVNATLWVAYNGTNYGYASYNLSNSTGHVILYFNPDCKFSRGPQYWIAGVLNNTCYEDKNITTTPTVTIIGNLINNITNSSCPSGWVCYDNQNVSIRGNTSDECGNSVNSAGVNFTVSHGAYQASCVPVNNETNGYYNCSWNVTGSPGGIYVINMTSSWQYLNNGSASNTSGFFHQISPVLSNANVTRLFAAWGANATRSQFTFTVNVSDDDDNTTVQLWESSGSPSGPWTLVDSQACNDCMNTTKTFTRMYSSCFDIGTWYWKINISDSFGYNDTTSGSSFVNVTKRNVTFTPIEGNSSNVSRVGMNSTLLKMQVIDEYTNSALTGSGRYAYFWVTANSSSMEWGPLHIPQGTGLSSSQAAYRSGRTHGMTAIHTCLA